MVTRVASLQYIAFLIFIFITYATSFSYERITYDQNHHSLVRRSWPSNPYEETLLKPINFREHHYPPPSFENSRHATMTHEREHTILHPSNRDENEDTMTKALVEKGFTRVVYDDQEVPTEGDDYYYDNDDQLLPERKDEEHVSIEKYDHEKKHNENYPKKFHTDEAKNKRKENKIYHGFIIKESPNTETVSATPSPDHTEDTKSPVTESPVMSEHKSPVKKKDNPPLVLPVTTEGKANTKHKTEDPLKVYGFPKELLPIMPGGGSRFEDVEREKLERKKMSQTKGGDDDSAESGSSHEAEGLYSSASLSSISLCFYWLISFYHLDRVL